MSDTRTYNDLDEVLNAMDSWWGKRADEIERTKENETILSDGLFWCGVNMIRFTYPQSHIDRLMSFFLSVKECWKRANNEQIH